MYYALCIYTECELPQGHWFEEIKFDVSLELGEGEGSEVAAAHDGEERMKLGEGSNGAAGR
jgi:hypothetical protein